MRSSFYFKDYETEKIFSYLRWIFLLISIILFYYPPLANILNFDHRTFPILLTCGFVYMAVSQIALQRMDSSLAFFPILMKAGILFDYFSLMWLLCLTGGPESSLVPISFLLVMHATIFWRTKGALISSLFSSAGYGVIFALQEQATAHMWFVFVINIFFIWVIGLFGSLIVLRERKHMKMMEHYHELLVTDYLTGLYNHRHFQEHLRKLTEEESPFYLIIGDIDSFKKINDSYGHLAGDEVLRSLGGIFKGVAERYNGLAFRYGGEEFAFLLPADSKTFASTFIEDTYARMNEKYFTSDAWTATMSFGVALFTFGQTADELLSVADELLYRAKDAGKRRACFEDGKKIVNETQLDCLLANG